MRHLDTMKPVVDAFEAVGASVPVRLTLEQKARLVDVVRVWGDQADQLPEGVPDSGKSCAPTSTTPGNARTRDGG